MAYKKLTVGEYKKQFGGLNRLRFEWQENEVEYGHGILLPVKFYVACAYNKKKDCTYIMMSAIGYFNMCGLKDEDPCIVVKEIGKTELTCKDVQDRLIPYIEELEMEWRDNLHKKEKES